MSRRLEAVLDNGVVKFVDPGEPDVFLSGEGIVAQYPASSGAANSVLTSAGFNAPPSFKPPRVLEMFGGFGGGSSPSDSPDSGSSILHQATVTLTDADIKATTAGSTRFPLLASPGANKMFLPVSWSALADFAAGAYTGITADDAFFGIDCFQATATGLLNTASSNQFSALFGSAASSVVFGTTGSNGSDIAPGSALTAAPASVVNRGMNVQIYNSDGELGGGNAANTILVSVAYLIWNLSTGEFE